MLALFGAGDLVAHFTHYKYGETFSAAVWWVEKKFWVFHLVVGVILVVLFTHLEFRQP